MSNKDLPNPYLHKQVSLLSTSDVRYDGRLYVVDNDANTLALQHVKCMGTEGRRGGEHAIAPSDCMYEFIIFRAENIKKLYVVEDNRFQDITDEILEPLQSKPVRQGDVQQHNYSHSGASASRGGRHGAGSTGPTGPTSRAATARTTRSNEAHAPMTYERGSSYFSQTARSSGLQPVEDPQAHLSQHNGRETTTQMQMHKRKVGIKKQAPYADSRAKYDYGYHNDYGYPAQTHSSHNYASRASRQTKTRSYANSGYSNGDSYFRYHQYRGNSATTKRTIKDQNSAIRTNNYRKGQGYYVNNYKRGQVAQQQSSAKVKRYSAARKPPRKQETTTARAGTGEYLERRQLVGTEIEVPKEDLDFAASLAKLESTRENESKKQSTEKEANNKDEKQPDEKKTTETQSQQVAGAKPEDTVTITHGKRAYDKDDFFDQLNLNTTKKENAKEKKEELALVAAEDEYRNLDVETFGSVAEQYRFAARPTKVSKNVKINSNSHTKRQFQYKQSAKNKQYRPQQSKSEKTPKKSQGSTKKGQKSQKQEYRSRRVIWQPREQNSKV